MSAHNRAAMPRPTERVTRPQDIPSALKRLGLRCGRPVMVSVGGAGRMAPKHLELVRTLLLDHVLPVLERCDAAVVDGGTDSGVMRVMGDVFFESGTRLPLVGVSAEGTVAVPGRPGESDRPELEAHHSHALLVPGSEWGAESTWISAVASILAGQAPSVTFVVNGGEITYDDVRHSLAAARPVLVVAGAGRTADAIAAAVHGHGLDERAHAAARSPLTTVAPLSDGASVAAALMAQLAQGLTDSRRPPP